MTQCLFVNAEGETLPLDDVEARIIVLPLRGPHLLERKRQRVLSNRIVVLAQRP